MLSNNYFIIIFGHLQVVRVQCVIQSVLEGNIAGWMDGQQRRSFIVLQSVHFIRLHWVEHTVCTFYWLVFGSEPSLSVCLANHKLTLLDRGGGVHLKTEWGRLTLPGDALGRMAGKEDVAYGKDPFIVSKGSVVVL